MKFCYFDGMKGKRVHTFGCWLRLANIVHRFTPRRVRAMAANLMDMSTDDATPIARMILYPKFGYHRIMVKYPSLRVTWMFVRLVPWLVLNLVAGWSTDPEPSYWWDDLLEAYPSYVSDGDFSRSTRHGRLLIALVTPLLEDCSGPVHYS